jgi:glycosyltransferase involved in cell wall biosynthesis
MLISIVIPTRERAETLRFSLAACLRIDDPNIEIIVSDNASLDDTAQVVAAADDPRVRYVRTAQRCSMRENFEFAVGHARGDYVLTMGDDDAPIPNQFPYMRALLEEHRPDSLTGTTVKYAWPDEWPGDSAPKAAGRIKLVYRTSYGKPDFVSGEQLRAEIEAKGAQIKWDAPRIYGGTMSRRVIENLRAKSGQLFMGSAPDYYITFAAPSVIDRHIKIKHPFFIGAASPKSNGINFLAAARGAAPEVEYDRFRSETKLDAVVDPIPLISTLQICEFSLLEAANRYVYDGALRIDYAREFDRALGSLRAVEPGQRSTAVEALARFAVEKGLSADLRDPSALLRRCPPWEAAFKSKRVHENRSFVSIDRVLVYLDQDAPTDIDAAASVYERLLDRYLGKTPRVLAWIGLLARAMSMLGHRMRRSRREGNLRPVATGAGRRTGV